MWPSWLLAGNAIAPAGVEDAEAGAVALVDDEVRQRRGQQLGVFQLVGVAFAVEHRAAGVEQDVADEVGLLLVLLDGVAFGAAVALPVDVADVVAGDVLAVLDELDGEAAERALVVADAQALDDGRGPSGRGPRRGRGRRVAGSWHGDPS